MELSSFFLSFFLQPARLYHHKAIYVMFEIIVRKFSGDDLLLELHFCITLTYLMCFLLGSLRGQNCKVALATLRTELTRFLNGGYTAVDPTLHLDLLSMPC